MDIDETYGGKIEVRYPNFRLAYCISPAVFVNLLLR